MHSNNQLLKNARNTLILISQAHSDTAFKLVKEMHEDKDELHLLFTGKGIHYLDKGDVLNKLEYAKLYTFETEFDSPKEHIKAISYDKFVELLEKCERIFAWI
jgi:sulfur transfer complex TusBCD TusB component (DsrH family)